MRLCFFEGGDVAVPPADEVPNDEETKPSGDVALEAPDLLFIGIDEGKEPDEDGEGHVGDGLGILTVLLRLGHLIWTVWIL